MTSNDYRIRTETSEYIESLFAQESEALKNTRMSAPESGKHMMITAEDGKLLATLAQIVNAKRILEIGTFVGYSTIWLAQSMPSDGKVITVEKNTEIFNIAKNNFANAGLSSKIIPLNIDGNELEKSEIIASHAPFDLVFIDANKSGYIKYFDFADKHLAKNGAIILDNALFHNEVILSCEKPSKAALDIRKANEYVANHPNYSSTIISSSDGMLIAKKIS